MDQDHKQPGTGWSNQHLSAQQRAGEIASVLQQARGECLDDLDKVQDEHARELFGRIAGYLEVAIEALYSYQGGDQQDDRIVH